MINILYGILIALSLSTELLLIVKATLLLSLALAAVLFAKRARASERHVLLAAVFVALVALPLVTAAVPTLAVEMPAPSRAAEMPPYVMDVPPGRIAENAVRPAGYRPPWTTTQWLRAAWAAGAIAFLIPVAVALWRLSMIRRTGIPVAWHRDELARLADARGVSRPVELLEHEAVPGPMTFGITRPVIVLPLDAREWSEAELRRALMHEIEHIQRGDWLMQIVARTVAAFYWFHPLVWTAWRRLGLEAERSCDDVVVMSEERTDYAAQLVTLAQRMSATPVQPMLGMANRSDLSTRVTAVLDDRLRRGRAGVTLALGTMAATAFVVMTVAPVRAITALAVDEQPAGQTQARQRERASRASRALDLALFEAAREGDLAGVKELLTSGANAGALIEGDGSPLMGAAEAGNVQILNLLLDVGADPNGVVKGDGSPLIKAAQRGVLEAVQALIVRGADVNLAVEGDENPLMGAAENGHLAIVRLLVDRGADVHTKIWTDKYNGGGEWRTAISQARKNGHVDVVTYLQSRGARE